MGVFNFGRFALGTQSLALALFGLGCGGPTLADLEQDELVLTVTAVASDAKVAAPAESPGGLAVSRAYVSASAVTLLPCLSDASALGLGARGYELAQDPPMTERITTAVSEYCGLRVEIDPVDDVAAEGVEPGTTLYVAARDAAGNDVTLTSDRSVSLLFEAESDASFGDQPLLLGFDVSTWLAGLPLAEEMADESALQLAAQLPTSAALYVDRNLNHALDADEQTPVARASSSR
jgi:hypothetical protein